MASSQFLESLPEVTDYDPPGIEANTLNSIPQNIPHRLSGLLYHLPKLNVIDSIHRPLETFTLFPNLPIELRLKIWNYSSRQSRTLLLSHNWYLDRDDKRLKIESIENENKVPAVLQACSESRQEGLKHYTACAKRCSHDFDSRQTHGYTCENQGCLSKHVYINFDADRFLCYHLSDRPFSDEYQLDKKDLAMIEFLDIECYDPWLRDFDGLEPILMGGGLKELNIVIKERAWGGSLLPNTIDRELHIKGHEKHLRDYIELVRQQSWNESSISEDEEDEESIEWQLLDGVEVAYKWSWMVEEYDLVPISAGVSAGYVAAGGV